MKEETDSAANNIKNEAEQVVEPAKEQMRSRRLVRPRSGRMIAGVAIGIANYLGINVTIVRLIWVLLLLPGGLPGLLLYLICWIVIPSE